ncbi:MAG: ABC transporter substrate-binding protein [Betaproteobacteria bacterium]|nr:ABC transporter substrate-binding protein [Betaproteobacteria bacterium]MDE1982165.1 ABC transporter substrate-binding protein [Betaproteobacteria bacterium]MDE2211308.1 ABC transporter substrate-binding protein [Betaproteobacteria bacterium]MDE2353849.1 ABC transporter substrate-binding protein [Betaproteobacteria bacterium]
MNGMKMVRAGMAGLLLLAGLWAQASAVAGPDAVIRKTADEVIAAVKADKAIQSGDRTSAYKLIDQKVLPHFDFERMTRLAVGRNWRQAAPEQQKQLVGGFRDLLVRTYASSLSQYKDQVVQIKGTDAQPGDAEAVVHTLIVPSGGQSIPIDYSMEKANDDWKVYDIRVDGVSLVTNYRSEFTDIVRRSGVDGLIKALEEKSRAAEKK